MLATGERATIRFDHLRDEWGKRDRTKRFYVAVLPYSNARASRAGRVNEERIVTTLQRLRPPIPRGAAFVWCSAMAYVTPNGRFGHSTGLYRKTNPLLTALTPQYQPESPFFRGNQFFTG